MGIGYVQRTLVHFAGWTDSVGYVIRSWLCDVGCGSVYGVVKILQLSAQEVKYVVKMERMLSSMKGAK